MKTVDLVCIGVIIGSIAAVIVDPTAVVPKMMFAVACLILGVRIMLELV